MPYDRNITGPYMGLHYRNLNDATRRYMLEEVDMDLSENRLYLSNRLTSIGKERYPSLLRDAVAEHSDDWLSRELVQRGLMATMETKTVRGKIVQARVPVTAPVTLAEGEFNRFYLRGLCRLSIDGDLGGLEVYRGKAVANPRTASTQLIGQRFGAVTLLSDLRQHIGVDTALGLPSGPNSGLTARLEHS